MNPTKPRWLALIAWGVFGMLLATGRVGAAEALAAGVFASVDGTVITSAEYAAVVRGQARGRFYHGQAPEAELAAFRQEVGESLILRTLLVREAERRGIGPDEDAVARKLAQVERRFAGSPDWAEHRERILSDVARQQRRDSRIAALEAQVRAVGPPTEAQVRAYYDRHPDKFTTPERIRVSLIMLRVPPSGSTEQWTEARSQSEQFAEQLRRGAPFSELARLHSQDASAAQGGDLGYLHRDMLGEGAHEAIDTLRVGEISAPVQLLEGYALLRLTEREPARLNPLDAVRERASALWQREAQDAAWAALRARLRQAAVVRVDQRHYEVEPQAAASQRPVRN